jgi:hypothetical protein
MRMASSIKFAYAAILPILKRHRCKIHCSSRRARSLADAGETEAMHGYSHWFEAIGSELVGKLERGDT